MVAHQPSLKSNNNFIFKESITVKRILPVVFALGLLIISSRDQEASGQSITTPQVSPKAVVSQTIGLTDVTITYHRPAVKGRKIWGGLVPFDGGKPIPWRAGANENTTISFTHDVLIEGKRLGAGTYGLHMIPSAKEWVVIFSKNYTSWGSFSYREDEDALRVTVQPRPADFQEWLSYGFDVNDSFSTTVILHWEKLAVPFIVQVADGEETVLANIRNELRSVPGFTARGYTEAAQYCLQRKINTDEALAWTDQAIARGGAFQALQVKSGLLAQAGKKKESEDLLRGAVENATENELNTYGYTLLNENKIKEAVEIFTMNVKRHPDSWNVYDSLGEGHDKAGDKKSALKNYKKALSMAPETQKSRISGILKNLETGL